MDRMDSAIEALRLFGEVSLSSSVLHMNPERRVDRYSLRDGEWFRLERVEYSPFCNVTVT